MKPSLVSHFWKPSLVTTGENSETRTVLGLTPLIRPLIAWDEALFNLNDTDWGSDPGLDQNRAFLGFGYKSCPHAPVRTEIGYLNQFINNQGGNDGMNHILSINFFF